MPGPEVVLRPLVPDDAAAIAAWADDGEFREAAGWSLDRTRAELEAFHRRLIEQPPPDLLRLAAVADDTLVGYVDLHGVEAARRELGFVVGPSARWSHGLGTAAGRAGLAHGFDRLGLDEVWSEALGANAASVRVLQRLGMRETGDGGEDTYRGTASRYRQFVLTRQEWQASAAAG